MLDPTPAALPLRPADDGDDLHLVESRYDAELARELIAEVQAEYVVRYGGQDDSPVDPEEFTPPRGSFLLATVDGVVVGSVALRRHVSVEGDDEAADDAGDVCAVDDGIVVVAVAGVVGAELGAAAEVLVGDPDARVEDVGEGSVGAGVVEDVARGAWGAG